VPVTQYVEFVSKETPATVKLVVRGTDSVTATASAVAQRTNAPGRWLATFVDVAAGCYGLFAVNANSELCCEWDVDLLLVDGTYISYEPIPEFVRAFFESANSIGEPASVPGWGSDYFAMFKMLMASVLNARTQSNSTFVLRNYADNDDVGSRSVSSDGTTLSVGSLS